MSTTSRLAAPAPSESIVFPTSERPVMTALPVTIPASRPAVAGPHGAPVRLTRRGRLVITLLVVTLLALAMIASAASSMATDEAGEAEPTRTVVVESGDTLWGIAEEVAAPGGTQAMVHQIQNLNSLSSVSLDAGQRIEVPLG